MEKSIQNYTLAVYHDWSIKKLSLTKEGAEDFKGIKFLIHRKYYRRGEKIAIFYKTEISNPSKFDIKDNTFDKDGIKCTVHEKDVWEKNRYDWNHKTECIEVDIWDKLDVKKTIYFSTNQDCINAFNELFNYMTNLSIMYTHTGCELLDNIIYHKNREINDLKINIKSLQK